MLIKLAEALLRRKELNEKVEQLKPINVPGLFEVKARRKNVTENIDDIVAEVPKIKLTQVTAAFDFYSRQLRLIDAAIQQANWGTEVSVPDGILDNYTEPDAK